MSRKKKREKALEQTIELSELSTHVEYKRTARTNTCSSCKDVHEVSNTPGDYGCPSCGFTLNIK